MGKQIFAKILVLLLLLVGQAIGQTDPNFSLISKESKPSIGLGLGVFNFYGDVNSLGKRSSLINQFGYEVHVARKINDFSDVGFSFLTGTMLGNERSPERNLNFRTNINSVSVYATFNLDYWLYFSDVFNPFVTIGFESFEYNNKADLVDANGNPYFYWDDGTIRDIDQSSANANQASLMTRDYVYETDLRSANLDGLGKYPQLAIGLPVGLGFNLNVSDRLAFKFTSVFHYTFTDLIDNVSKAGEGNRKGNSLNDFFTFNSFSIHYDLLNSPPSDNPEDFEFPDYFVLDMADTDGDGVVDGIDICPFTPKDVEVDEFGCPLDSDNDGVPNYKDREEGSADGVFVGADGVTLTDEDFYNWYLRYIDSAAIPVEILYKMAGQPRKSVQYRILLGEYRGSLPEDLARRFVEEGDVIAALNRRNETAYLTKKYGELKDAERRRDELLAKNMPKATIVVWEGKDYYTLEEWKKKEEKELKERYDEHFDKKEGLEKMYAVKLGDESADASKTDKAKYFEYEDVVVLKGDSNKSEYLVGPFIDQVGAKQILQNVDRKKYPNAEVVKVQNGTAQPTGITMENTVANSNPKGAKEWNETRVKKTESPKKILEHREGNYVIEFDKPKTKQEDTLIKAAAEVVRVKTADGKEQIITKAPQSKSFAHNKVEELQQKGINAKVVRVEDGKLMPVTETTEEKNKRRLANLGNGFVINFGGSNEKSQEKAKEILNDGLKTVDLKNGEQTTISSAPVEREEAIQLLKELKENGVEASVAELKDGDLIPMNSNIPTQEQQEQLDRLEDKVVVDLGSPDDPKTKKVIDKIKETTEVVKVITSNGEKKLVTKEPLSLEKAIEVVDELKDKKIDASIGKVNSGKVETIKASTDEIKKQNQLLGQLEDAFVINFGSGKKENEIKAQTQDAVETKTVVTNEGEQLVISDQPKTKEEAKALIKELKEKNITATVAQVKNGGLEDVKFEATKTTDKEEMATMNDKKAVEFGAIDNPTKQKVYDDLVASGGFEEVQGVDGSKTLVAMNPDAEAIAEKKLQDLGQINSGITKAIINDGEVVEDKRESPTAGNQVLNTLNDNFAINFGQSKNEKLEALKQSDDFEEITKPNGDKVIVAKTLAANKELEAVAKKLKAEGETVKTEQVINGALTQVDEIDASKAPKTNQQVKAAQTGDRNPETAQGTTDQVSPIETPQLPNEELTPFEDNFVVKLGTIDNTTTEKEKKALLNAPNTVQIPNEDGTIDIISAKKNAREEQTHEDKAYYQKLGFDNAKVAFVKDKKLEVLKKEKLDGKYSISLGSFASNVPNEDVNKISSIGDVESMETFNPDITTYTVGNYNNPVEAKERIEELTEQGFKPELVKYEGGKVKKIDFGTVFDIETVKRLKLLYDESTIVKTDEVVFRVQLGAYRNKIPENVFKGVKTLSFPSSGGITKYVTGSFNTYQQAYIHKLTMRSMGFEGAFTVAYKDGKQIKVTDLVNQEKFNQIKQTVSPVEKELKKVVTPIQKATENPAKVEKSGISYRVQLGAYKGDEMDDKLATFPNVEMEVYGQYKRYLSGDFDTYRQASEYKKEVKAKGFNGAFVVAYNNGKRVAVPGDNPNVINQSDLDDANKSTNQVAPEFDKKKVMILIQVGLYRGDIPGDLKEKYNELPNLTKQVTAHGVIRYMSGNFNNLEEAAAFKEELVKKGFDGAFLVAYYDNERIKIQKAIEILKQ